MGVHLAVLLTFKVPCETTIDRMIRHYYGFVHVYLLISDGAQLKLLVAAAVTNFTLINSTCQPAMQPCALSAASQGAFRPTVSRQLFTSTASKNSSMNSSAAGISKCMCQPINMPGHSVANLYTNSFNNDCSARGNPELRPDGPPGWAFTH
jgi:hypothetical protein